MPRPVKRPLIAWEYSRLGFIRVAGSTNHACRCFTAAAVKHLQAWFVDPATRMNPSLEYSQAIKGRFTGRGIGVVDTVHLAEVALGTEALRGSKALSTEIERGVVDWFRDY